MPVSFSSANKLARRAIRGRDRELTETIGVLGAASKHAHIDAAQAVQALRDTTLRASLDLPVPVGGLPAGVAGVLVHVPLAPPTRIACVTKPVRKE
ncbi:MAG: hypothetical protein BRD51_05460 [Bacteroidetes bacterium SW_11_64_17]|nr:MAG: hypothetical protein BRD51_05460 [Bacteroidetes bacterium SW_11_64_17]